MRAPASPDAVVSLTSSVDAGIREIPTHQSAGGEPLGSTAAVPAAAAAVSSQGPLEAPSSAATAAAAAIFGTGATAAPFAAAASDYFVAEPAPALVAFENVPPAELMTASPAPDFMEQTVSLPVSAAVLESQASSSTGSAPGAPQMDKVRDPCILRKLPCSPAGCGTLTCLMTFIRMGKPHFPP